MAAMCSICDGQTYDALHRHTAQLIDEGGWRLLAVGGWKPWTYTIGLAERGHPELVAVGPPQATGRLLDEAAALAMDGRPLSEGSALTVLDQSVQVGAVHPRHIERGLVAGWFDYYVWAGRRPALKVLELVRAAGSRASSQRTLSSSTNLLRL